MTKDIIFAFIGGTVIGASGAVAVMKKIGYIKPEQNPDGSISYKVEMTESDIDMPPTDQKGELLRDKPSFETPEKIDTSKTLYNSISEKPSLDDMMKRASLDVSEEEKAREVDYIYDGDLKGELGEKGDYPEPIDEDLDYGHVVMQLPARRKDDLIFLIHQDYAGECYLLEDLIYYAKDDVLADVTDAPVDDPMTIIGDSLGYFGVHADEGKLFVRNCTMGIEYEITWNEGRYSDKLYGVDTSEIEEPKKQIKTKMRKEREK